jgi:hypothetical protein
VSYEILEISDDYQRLIGLKWEIGNVVQELDELSWEDDTADIKRLRYAYLYTEWERLDEAITRQRNKLLQNRRACGELRDP